MQNFSPLPPPSTERPRTAAAAAILLHRRAVRAQLTEWARHCDLEPARHHRLLIEKLEAVSRGETDRLLVCMPPGAAKSTYTSVLFPGWFLAQHPSASVIAASHTTELSERWGRRVRNLILEHGQTIGLALRSDSQAAGRWQLESGGEYLAAGVGQAILGFRADLIVIDDPIRSREDAASDVIRRSVWEWYSADLKTRLKPGGRIVMISTRWHEDDLPGRVLAEMEKNGDVWDTLILPAQAEENDPLGRKAGEFLWDDDSNYEYGKFLRRELSTQPPMNWAALYQQRPAPESGDYFKLEWLKPYEKPPEIKSLRTYAASDYAVTSKGGDYTVHLVVGICPENKLYLLDLWRAQATPDVWVERMLDLALQWKPISWAEEVGQIRASVGPFIDRRMTERKIPLYRQQFPTRHDKAVRAQAIRGRMSLAGLHVPVQAPWYAAFQQELLTFPAGHDDQVDALGLIGQMLEIIVPDIRPKKRVPGYDPSKDPYREFSDDTQLSMYARGELDPDYGADEFTNVKTM
jgi:predicted phage terminase large subunit-like protein